MSLRLHCECEYCQTGQATTHNDPSHDQSLFSSFTILGSKTIEISGGTTKAARVTLRYLLHHFGDNVHAMRGLSAIELGAGTALIGQAMVLLGANVVFTDQEPVLEIVKENLEQNLGFEEYEGKAEIVGLYWGEEKIAEKIKEKMPFDIVVCSDLIFAHENIPLLLKTLDLLCPKGEKTYILFAHIDRFSWEKSFFEGMKDKGFAQTQVFEDVDIKIFKFTRA
jgi:predicted nicotinamide N-methyase